MPTPDKQSGSSGGVDLDRRDVLKSLGAAGAVGLAGCSGNGGNGNGNGGNGNGNGGNGNGNGGGGGDLGERVPDPIILEYWSDMGAETTQWEQILPDMQANIEDALDVNVEVRPTEFATQVSNITNDQRTHHLSLWYHTNTPDRLDPQEMTRRFAIDWAGGNGNANPNNWANCEFSDPALNQAFAPDEETRQELVTEAHGIMAENMATLPFLQTMLLGAVDNTKVDLAGAEQAGIINTNANVFMLSTPKGKDSILVNGNPTEWETTNFPTNQNSGAVQLWSHLICSPLAEYDENLELTGVLASDWETEEDGSLIRAHLEEDMQFHDGSEITATDVQFTFQHMWENPGSFPQGGSPPYNSIDVVDEKTVEFVFDGPYLPLISREWPRWGIFNRDVWEEAGMPDNPSAGSAPLQETASGPFMLTNFTQGEFAALDPHPHNHPKYNVDHGVDFQVYSDTTAATEAFLARELDMFQKASPGAISRMQEEGGDWATTVEIPGFMGHQIYPQMNIAPGKFRAFRKAIGQTYDIDLFNEIGWRQQGNPDTLPVSIRQTHPFRLDSWEEDFPHYTESTGPSFEAARQTLMDAGWGYDDNGNLRYPADADTSALWPAESTPIENPGDWECINSNGEVEF